jgi:TonB family protein
MLSHSVLVGNVESERQFVDDLTNLCKRHKINCGDPQDIRHLGADLLSNESFRIDLFTLCTAISHMTEADLSPEQLLFLVVCAFGGSGTSFRDATIDLPQDVMSAFLDGYETWSKRDPDPQFEPLPLDPLDPGPDLHSPPSGRSFFYDAAARAEADPDSTDDPQHGHSTNGASSHRHIPGNTPLEDLTLSELRMYLEDIENRVRRIEPQLKRIAPKVPSSIEPFQPPKTLNTPNIHQANTNAVSLAPEPAIASATVVATEPTEPALEAAAPSLTIIPPQDAIPPDYPSSTSDAAHLRRLRIINAVLTFLLIVVCGSAAIVAWRYLRSHPAPFSTQPIAAPAGGSPSKPSAANSDANATPHDDLSLTNSPALSQVHHPGNIASTSPLDNHPQSLQSQPAIPPPVTATPVDTIKAELPPVQIPETTAPSYVNKPITVAPTAGLQDHSRASLSSSGPQPELNEPEQKHSSPPAEPRPLAASVTPTPTKPAGMSLPSPVAQPAKLTNLIVAVPPATMMTYALSAPKPVYPRYRHLRTDTPIDVAATISKDGKVTSARALNGDLDVQGAVVQTVQTWRFKPYILDGIPVTVSTTFKFVFKAP